MVSSATTYTYACIGVGILGALLSLLSPHGGLAFLGSILCFFGSVLGVLFWRYGYFMIPLITERTKIIMLSDLGYEVPPSQDVIVKASSGVYYASAFLGLKISESATEKSTEETMVYNQFFERAISNIKYVTKVAYMLFVEDVGEKRKTVEAKRAEALLRLQRERDKSQPDSLRVDQYEREVSIWDSQLTKLIKGVKPMGVIAYAQTTAVGLSKDAAIASARTQANELKTVLANALNVEVVQLTGDEMLKCFEWDKFFPISPQDLEESVV